MVQLVQLVVDADVGGLVQDPLSDEEHRVDEGADQRHRQELGGEDRDEHDQRAGRQGARHDREPFVELHADLRREEDARARPMKSEGHAITPRRSIVRRS